MKPSAHFCCSRPLGAFVARLEQLVIDTLANFGVEAGFVNLTHRVELGSVLPF